MKTDTTFKPEEYMQGIKAVFVAELPSTKERIADGQQHNEFWGDYPDIWDEPWGRVHRPFDSRYICINMSSFI